MMPRFLDIEASSLNMDSYPIEIAWSDSSGNIESYLINPYSVDHWTDWDYCAQQMHGISRQLCREEGIHPAKLCRIMNRSISSSETIYADGCPFDRWWIDALFSEGTINGYAEFIVAPTDIVMLEPLEKAEPDEKKRLQLYEGLKLQARKTIGARHRAEPDVRYLIELWKLCNSQI